MLDRVRRRVWGVSGRLTASYIVVTLVVVVLVEALVLGFQVPRLVNGAQLQAQVDGLEQKIKTFENELVTLKARAKTADSMKKINRQLAGVDPSGTIAMLERMKQKVDEDEATAQAYGEIADRPSSLDEVDRVLAETSATSSNEDLIALKKKMGLSE